MNYINTLKVLLTLVLSYGCQTSQWFDHTPKEFQGLFIQVTDNVITGWELPILFRINPDSLLYYNLENHSKSSYPIKTIEKIKDKIIIYCGADKEQFIREHKYELYWYSDGILIINEIVPTGINNDEAKFFLGKFTSNKYFMKGYEELIP